MSPSNDSPDCIEILLPWGLLADIEALASQRGLNTQELIVELTVESLLQAKTTRVSAEGASA